MIGHGAVKASRHLREPDDIDQKIGQLVCALDQTPDAFEFFRLVRKQIRVMRAHHAGA